MKILRHHFYSRPRQLIKKTLFLMLMIAGTQLTPALAQYGDGPYMTCRGHESFWDMLIRYWMTGTAHEWEWDTSKTGGGRCCQGSIAGAQGVHTTMTVDSSDPDVKEFHYDYESVPVSECQDNACAHLSEGY